MRCKNKPVERVEQVELVLFKHIERIEHIKLMRCKSNEKENKKQSPLYKRETNIPTLDGVFGEDEVNGKLSDLYEDFTYGKNNTLKAKVAGSVHLQVEDLYAKKKSRDNIKATRAKVLAVRKEIFSLGAGAEIPDDISLTECRELLADTKRKLKPKAKSDTQRNREYRNRKKKGTMSKKERTALSIQQHKDKGLSQSEVSTALGVSIRTVKSYWSTGAKKCSRKNGHIIKSIYPEKREHKIAPPKRGTKE